MSNPSDFMSNSKDQKDQKIEQVRQSVNSAIHHVSEAIHPAIDSVTTTAHNAVDRLAGAAGHAAENMELKSAEFNAARVRLTEKVRGKIQARPLTTIGVAVASGVVLSWLLRSRRSSN